MSWSNARWGVSLVGVLFAVFATATCALGEKRTAACSASAGALFGSPACDVAATERCCELAERCEADDNCLALAQCMRGCAEAPTEACYAQCRREGAARDTESYLFDQLANCVGNTTTAEETDCRLPEAVATDGACPDVVDPEARRDVFEAYPGETCGACVRTNMCAEATACAEDAGCRSRLRCFRQECADRPDPACYEQCTGANPFRPSFDSPFDPAAVVAFDDYLLALRRECAVPCNVGRQWRCPGYRWPDAASGEPIALALRLREAEQNVAIADVSVEAIFDPGESIGLPAITDADGLALIRDLPVMAVAGSNPGFQGWLELSPAAGSEFPDVILYRQRPESRDRIDPDDAPVAKKSQLNAVGYEDGANNGLITGQFFDCFSSFNWGMQGVYFHAAGGSVLYVSGFSAVPSGPSSVDGRFVVRDLEPGLTEVRVWATAGEDPDGELLAEDRVPVKAGWVTQAGVFPLGAPLP